MLDCSPKTGFQDSLKVLVFVSKISKFVSNAGLPFNLIPKLLSRITGLLL